MPVVNGTNSNDFIHRSGDGFENFTTTNSLGTGAINLTGNDFSQHMLGNAGSNTLDGRGGNDILDGGAGADSLAGGAGDAEVRWHDRGAGLLLQLASPRR